MACWQSAVRLGAVGILLAVLLSPSFPVEADVPSTACELDPSFSILVEEVGDERIGACLEEPIPLATGDVRQRTTRGELMWHQRDGVSTFSDGIRTCDRRP